MAVGSITSISISAYSTYINVSFAKPANTTKFLVTLIDPNTGYTFYSNYFSSGDATGNTVTCKVTGVIAGNSYIVYVTPYNGTTAGTQKQYLNSGTTNLVKVPLSTTSSQSSSTFSSSGPTTGATGSGAVSSTSSTGTTANGGTVAKSSAAAANTPTPGVVNAAAPSDLNAPGRITLSVTALSPNTTYDIKVRAVSTDSSGNTIYSDYSTPLNITTPGYANGGNYLSLNSNMDTQLAGGSVWAGTLSSTGSADPMEGSVDGITPASGQISGSGILLNQFGLAGYNNGTPEFYIDSRTGNAYFAGTIQATIIESTGYNGPTDGSSYSTSGTAFNLNNGSITSENFRIDTSGNAYFKGDVSAATINGQSAVSYIGSTSTLAAQDAANGVNKIYYYKGTGSSAAGGTAYGNAPNGTQYSVTGGTANGSSSTSASSNFPNGPLTSQSGVRSIDGDTWFVYDGNLVIIAQYTYSSSAGGWVQNKVGGLTIANIDAGVITTGVLRASIEITSPYISGGTISGAVVQTPGYLQAGKYGLAMTNTGSDSLFFSYGTTQVASMSAFSTGGISIQNLSDTYNSSLIVGPSPSNGYFSVVSVNNGNPSYGGSSGHLRNIWASPLSLNASPTGGSSGDIWVGW